MEEETQVATMQPDEWQEAHPWLVVSTNEDSPDEVICYSLDEIRF